MSDAQNTEQKITRRALFKRYVEPPVQHLEVSANCLNMHGIYCSSCRDECSVNAIKVRPALGGTLEIGIDQDACTVCMDCAKRCPNDALILV